MTRKSVNKNIFKIKLFIFSNTVLVYLKQQFYWCLMWHEVISMFVEHLGLMNYFIKDNALQMSLFTLNHLVFAFPHGLSLLGAPMQIKY